MEASDAELKAFIEREGRDTVLATVLLRLAREDSPLGFAAFYELVTGMQLPKHAEEWVEGMYTAHEQGKGTVIEAFRGSTKTSTLIAFIAFRIGHYPHKSYLLIQVGDDSATKTTARVADIIANNPAWKAVFPDVVPDREQCWGAGGYEVKNTAYKDYGEWRKLCGSPEGKGRDPTFVGLGYVSRSLIGKHPTGGLFVDDIHDESNTSSERELNSLIKILTGTIFPTMVPGAWKLFIGTPWVEGDALDYIKGTGRFVSMKTPVEVNGVLTWPEKFNQDEVDERRDYSGQREFARMYLLDLSQADEDGLKFYTYPHEDIKAHAWPGAGGCDYASIMEERQKQSKDRSFFAHLWGFKDPYGRIVVYDGVVERCTQADAEAHLWRPQVLFPNNWSYTMFEADGKGEEAYAVFRRNPLLNIVPFKVERIKKTRRHEIQLAPWLENGKILISDGDTPALNHLRKALKKWPHWHLDAIDAMYALVRAFPEALVLNQYEDGIPLPKKRKEKKTAPVYSFSRESRQGR